MRVLFWRGTEAAAPPARRPGCWETPGIGVGDDADRGVGVGRWGSFEETVGAAPPGGSDAEERAFVPEALRLEAFRAARARPGSTSVSFCIPDPRFSL